MPSMKNILMFQQKICHPFEKISLTAIKSIIKLYQQNCHVDTIVRRTGVSKLTILKYIAEKEFKKIDSLITFFLKNIKAQIPAKECGSVLNKECSYDKRRQHISVVKNGKKRRRS